MSIPVTVCGIVAKQGWEPFAWETRLDHMDLAEADPAVAVEFVRLDVHQEGIANGNSICEYFAAAIHPGSLRRDHTFDYTDIEVCPEDELHRWPTQTTWTICGMYLDTGETYSQPWVAHGPAMAYLAAWEQARDDGRTLLLAGAHLGIPDADTDLNIRYADTRCDTAEEMLSVLREWAPTPKGAPSHD